MNYIFISHAEKDAEIAKEFVELLYHIGLKEKNIFCSSISEIGVPVKKDIYEYLRNLLDSENVIPIFMLSDNYYASAACLNEMGAVWLKQTDYYTVLLPGFSFSQIKGAINPNKRGLKLDSQSIKGDLTNLKNDLKQYFRLPKISEQRWEKYRDSFIDSVDKLKTSGNNQEKSDHITLSLEANQTFCVGHVNRGACDSTIDERNKSVHFQYDFSKTAAQLCSLAIFAGNINLKQEFRDGKQLEFWIKGTDSVTSINVEMHLQSMNPAKAIAVTCEWGKVSIPLVEFVNLESLWEICKEICFVVDRTLSDSGEIEIKELRIT